MSFLAHYWHVALIGAVLGLIAIGFLFRFVFPARRLGRELDAAIAQLGRIKAEDSGRVTDLERVAAEVMTSDKLAHCWSEFTETLHAQMAVNALGQEEVVRYRATALAETFFTDQVLVETPLQTEFYKHLPGILTGVGIIGTFSGLILGLIDFQVSGSADQVRQSLAGLIQNVGHAFIISASAILLAMLFTWIEKSRVTKRFRQVEELCVLIDSLFDAGAGEEYLARLVQASETSATQAAQIKDALVADLKEILVETTKQQISAAAAHSQQLSESMARTFSDSLKEPITRISQAVERVSGSQGEAVNRLLTDVLSSFTAQMQDMFGGQLKGLNEVLLQTSQAIQVAAGKFDQMAANLQSAGQGAVDQMAVRMEQLIGAMESRQEAMNARMAEFVEQIRQAVDGSQSEAVQKMQALMSELGAQVSEVVQQLGQQARAAAAGHEAQVSRLEGQLVQFLNTTQAVVTRYQRETAEQLNSSLNDLGGKASGLIATLQEQGQQAAAAHEVRQAEFSRQAEATLGRLANQVEGLTQSVQSATKGMRETAAQMATATRDSVDRMNAGAETLRSASTGLAQGLAGMHQATEGISGTSDKLAAASDSLAAAVHAAQQVMNEYRATRDTFAGIVDNLRAVIENARREASLTSEMVARLQSATEKLGAAQQEAEDYLKGVTEVLAEAHKAFAENVARTLRQGNAQFHIELDQAVNLLKGGIQDLGETLEAAAVRG